jgi:hypothetical protein
LGVYGPSYRDKKVVGVFVRFLRAPLQLLFTEALQNASPIPMFLFNDIDTALRIVHQDFFYFKNG